MNNTLATRLVQTSLILSALAIPAAMDAQHLQPYSIFATGAAVNATGPDSIAVGEDSIWVSYSNGADSTGLNGSSTIVQYSRSGKVRQQLSIPGYVDGLKVDPRTGLVWALQNQDGNSTLTLIDPEHGITPHSPLSYAVASSARGYDDVVFRGDQVFLSYTNPTGSTDPTIQLLTNRVSPLTVTTVLTMGATGTNLATGQANQPTTQNDPDSMKITPSGDLMLSSAADGQLIFVKHPGRANQSVAFLTVLDPSTGNAVSELDDAIFATAEKGTFYLSDTGNNRVLAIKADEIPGGSLYASVGSLKEFVRVNTKTGLVTALVANLNGPHGLVFVPDEEEEE
jgi:hypothetical protein